MVGVSLHMVGLGVYSPQHGCFCLPNMAGVPKMVGLRVDSFFLVFSTMLLVGKKSHRKEGKRYVLFLKRCLCLPKMVGFPMHSL